MKTPPAGRHDATPLWEALLSNAGGATIWRGLHSFWIGHRERVKEFVTPFDRAVLGGAQSDRVAGAFVAGYQAALRALLPELDESELISLCVTERGGAHPSQIATSLEPDDRAGGWRMNGQKQWSTGAQAESMLLVVASQGRSDDGRNRLRVARVAATAPGVGLESMPAPPFVPEVPHCRVTLDGVAVAASDLLDGDGYTAVVKPFRTVEDVHVAGAVLGHLIGVALRSGWPDEAIEGLLAALAGGRALALARPSAAATHLAVAGFWASQRRLFDRLEPLWALVEREVRDRWWRDRALLGVAKTARGQRRAAAWRRVRGGD